MPETVEMVTLIDGEGNKLYTHANAELSIQETSTWSGYNPQVLRRLDNDAKPGFPRAHHKLGSSTRLWYARDIAGIIQYKIKTAENEAERRRKVASKRAAKKAKVTA